MTSNISKGLERLKKDVKLEGKKEGIVEGKVEILIKILVKKFNIKPEEYIDKIRNLSDEVIDNIIIDIFDIERIDELEKYFKYTQNAPNSVKI